MLPKLEAIAKTLDELAHRLTMVGRIFEKGHEDLFT
jgi:hypothetical protein